MEEGPCTVRTIETRCGHKVSESFVAKGNVSEDGGTLWREP